MERRLALVRASFPAVFGLVYFALPFWKAPWWQLLTAGVVLLLAAFLLQWLGGGLEGNFAKLAAMTALGFFGATFIEEVWWLVLIGVGHRAGRRLLGLARADPRDREQQARTSSRRSRSRSRCRASPALARLGLPDVFFFALFLASCPRFGLRTRLTWLAMALSFGATIALAEWLSGEACVLPGVQGRPARAAAAGPRLPGAERRPALARDPGG